MSDRAKLRENLSSSIEELDNPLARLISAIQAVEATNAKLTDEIAGLRTEASRLAAIEKAKSPSSNLRGDLLLNPDGSGAGSLEVYQQIIKKNWHGRLSRTHIVDVDRMPDSAKTELDRYLRCQLNKIAPAGLEYCKPDYNKVFATLSSFGLRLENRGLLVDVPVTNDITLYTSPMLPRFTNLTAYFSTAWNFEFYWEGSVLETLLQLARYRGLFDESGNLKTADW